ncbi:MAG TPA: polyribonucleotide nucleotidyltransferase [bacterium]|nr:polyribonucleotide nucleotidyltransferase [bacterium]
MMERVSSALGNTQISFETGRLAKQADGSILAQLGETVVLVAVVGAKDPMPGKDFFPLTVEYRERSSAAGRIPGGWFKREGRPRTKEILTSRLIDRPIRPLFPDGFFNEVQMHATVISADQENDSDVLAVSAASAALAVSDIPVADMFGCVRVGRVNGDLVINPTFAQREKSTMDLIVAASRKAVVMVEGEAEEESESVVFEAIKLAHKECQKIIDLQEQLVKKAGKPKRALTLVKPPEDLAKAVKDFALSKMKTAMAEKDKLKRQEGIAKVTKDTVEALKEKFPEKDKDIHGLVHGIESDLVREAILDRQERQDGRKFDEFRPITAETRVLPRTHGSALFTRGQTQALVTTTLGTKDDQQILEELEGEQKKTFMLHYNFPPYSVGEIKRLSGPGRREIGHGNLAERALKPLLPKHDDFPYTIQVTSDILESNGSSSMASVCGGSLSLMDAGVPLKAPCAGVALGLVSNEDMSKTAILTDIQGLEDHFGDMDFKVAGTRKGITAIQMDIKIFGLPFEVIDKGLAQAKQGRLTILDIMDKVLSTPQKDLSPFAPRIVSIKVPVDKIRDIIGKGGATIKKIQEDFQVEVNVEDDGTVHIASPNGAAIEKCKAFIDGLMAEAEEGKIYFGTVKKIMDFGAFVEILPGTDGLVHISQLDNRRVERVEDVLKEGDELLVKCIGIDPKTKKIKLSRKEALGLKIEDYKKN